MIPLSARRRPASGASYRGAALPPPVPRRAGPALPASGASCRAAARPAVPPRPKRPQANEDPLAAALAPRKAKRPKKASLRERPVTDLGGDDDDGQGPPRRATPRGVALPGESAVFCRERPRITKEAYAYVARQRAPPPPPPPPRRRAPPPRRAPVAKAPAAAPAAAPWLRPLGDDERKRLKASKGAHARQAQAERAAHGLNALAKLEKRDAAADDAAAKAALSVRVRCFKWVDCARLFEARPEACERRDHHIEMAFGMRRCFACGRCGKSTYSLERRPRGACACGADAWRNRENDSDVRAVAAPDTFRPALAEWTSTSDVSALVNNI